MQHLSIYARKITHKEGVTNIAHKYRANKLNIQAVDINILLYTYKEGIKRQFIRIAHKKQQIKNKKHYLCYRN